MSRTRKKVFAVISAAAILVGCSRSPEESFRRGVALYEQGRFAQAAECFERALRQAPATPQALTFLGVCRLRTGQTEDGLRCFREALKLDPQYAPARYNLALAQLEQGQLESAATLLRQVLQQPGAPAEARGYLALACNNLAVTAARQRDFARADKLLREARAADPNCAEVPQNLAALKARMETTKTPVTAAVTVTVAKAASAVPTNAAASRAAGAVAPTQAVPVAKAAPMPTPAVEMTPRPPVPAAGSAVKRRAALPPRTLPSGNRKEALGYFNQAVTLQQQGRLDGVVELYEKAIAADPSFAAAYYNLGNAYRDLKQVSRAFENYELALMADPKFSDARRNYAILLQQQGYIADALDQYEIILQEFPEDAAVHVTVAGLYAADRSTIAKAREHYEAYLRLVPNAPHAAEIRRWLEQNR